MTGQSQSFVLPGFLFEESGFTAQLCTTQECLHRAYRLRYRAYRSVDGIPKNPEEMATDRYDGQANARTHLIWYQGKPVASIRSLIWSAAYDWQTTTSVDAYRPAVESSLGLSIPLLESTRFVVDPEFQGRESLLARYLLFRIQTASSLFDRCQYVITAVRPKHITFYRRMMGFEPISDPQRVDGFTFDSVLLATPYTNRTLLAKKASLAALQLTDYEQYVRQMGALQTAYA